MSTQQKLIILGLGMMTLFLRSVATDRIPPHLSNDEISIAYDAYSLLHTGRDEHNQILPLSFQSHSTYKAPLAIYMAVLPTAVLGNTELSARLPSIVLGSLTVLLVGILVYQLSLNLSLAIVSSFVISITPWHIFFSRMIFEANLALFFVVLGTNFFLKGLRKKNNFAILISCFLWAISIYAYHTQWGFVPLFLSYLWLTNYRLTFKKPVYYLSGILFVLMVIPIFVNSLSNRGTYARANTEIITKEPHLAAQLNDPLLSHIRKSQAFVWAIVGSYSSYLNPGYIFFNGMNIMPRPDPYQVGLILPIFLPCLIVGIFKVKEYFGNNSKLIITWAILGPIIPALTLGGPNYTRNLITLVPYSILISVGCVTIWHLLKSNIAKSLVVAAVTISFLGFVVIYYYHFPIYAGENYQYGYKQIALFIKAHPNKYQKIIVDPRFGEDGRFVGVPHNYLPYFTYLLPQHMNTLYEFREINWRFETLHPEYLYVVPYSNSLEDAPSKNLKTALEIRLPNGDMAFKVYDEF